MPVSCRSPTSRFDPLPTVTVATSTVRDAAHRGRSPCAADHKAPDDDACRRQRVSLGAELGLRNHIALQPLLRSRVGLTFGTAAGGLDDKTRHDRIELHALRRQLQSNRLDISQSVREGVISHLCRAALAWGASAAASKTFRMTWSARCLRHARPRPPPGQPWHTASCRLPAPAHRRTPPV